MKKQLLLYLILILTLSSNSQISFEKGYYINDSDIKIDCLIKNIDWKNNPVEFEYKLTDSTEQEKKTIKSIKEFGIYGISKYIRSTLDIDRSSKDLRQMSTDKNPVFKQEMLFLKVLVQGGANLYSYEDGNLIRFFYNKDTSDIVQLIFKSYKISEKNIGKNNMFKQQLWLDLKCQNISMNSLKNINYKKSDLVNLFVKYNECNNSEFINFEENQERDFFSLTVRPGLNNSNLSIQEAKSSYGVSNFDDELGFRIGIEAEFILPFNKNKWTILLEPTYQYYKSQTQIAGKDVVADYKSIEIPIGIRHYFFLNNNSKIFINGSIIFDLANNSIIEIESKADLLIESTNGNLAFGFGYKYNDKYSLELRYHTSRDILANYNLWSADYKTLSVILGYSIF